MNILPAATHVAADLMSTNLGSPDNGRLAVLERSAFPPSGPGSTASAGRDLRLWCVHPTSSKQEAAVE
jgi:hypothetical protein